MPKRNESSPEIPMPQHLVEQLRKVLETEQVNLGPNGEVKSGPSPNPIDEMESVISRSMSYEPGVDGSNPKLKINGLNVMGEDPADGTRFLGRGDASKRIMAIMEDPVVLVADLATPEGKKDYEEAMALIAGSMGTYLMIEPERMSDPIIDPSAPRGFRVIAVVKYCKVTKVIVTSQEAYEEVREDKIKERFAHHEPIVLVDNEGKPVEPGSNPD